MKLFESKYRYMPFNGHGVKILEVCAYYACTNHVVDIPNCRRDAGYHPRLLAALAVDSVVLTNLSNE
jgi:hypothetical protein